MKRVLAFLPVKPRSWSWETDGRNPLVDFSDSTGDRPLGIKNLPQSRISRELESRSAADYKEGTTVGDTQFFCKLTKHHISFQKTSHPWMLATEHVLLQTRTGTWHRTADKQIFVYRYECACLCEQFTSTSAIKMFGKFGLWDLTSPRHSSHRLIGLFTEFCWNKQIVSWKSETKRFCWRFLRRYLRSACVCFPLCSNLYSKSLLNMLVQKFQTNLFFCSFHRPTQNTKTLIGKEL